MPARKKRSLHVKRSVVHGGRLHSPKSPSDWRAWYDREEDGTCPRGTHVATRYSKYKDPEKYCVRNCGQWNPKRIGGRGGTCYQKTPWMELCSAMRKLYIPLIVASGYEGDAKRQLMRVIMEDASRIYKGMFPRGRPTIGEFRSNKANILKLIDRFVGEFKQGLKTWVPEA